MNRMCRASLLALAVAGALATSAVVNACTIDGKATACANGRRAVHSPLVTKRLPAAVARTWALFTFTGHYRMQTTIHFTEDRAQLKTALSAETMRQVWRWDFGDGAHATGWSVTHHYRHPGAYRISVAAYYPSLRQYISFDEIHIVVTR